MKKTLALLLALMICLSLVACGSSTDSEVNEPAKVEVGGVEASGNSANAENGEAMQPAETEVSVEETVLVDEGGVKITAKSLSRTQTSD